jgi:hypothetical protein
MTSPGLRAAFLALAFAVAAGCDPTPDYPPPEQPLLGTVVFERDITMGDSAVDIWTQDAALHVDPGTIPRGEHLVVRELRGVSKADPAGDVRIAQQWQISQQPAAVQLLTATAVFAKPILLRLNYYALPYGSAQLFHADETAAAWSNVGPAPQSADQNGPNYTARLTEPHLWTLAYAPAGGPAPPSGLFRLTSVACGSTPVSPVPDETLDIEGGAFIWTRTKSCVTTMEKGRVVFDSVGATFKSVAQEQQFALTATSDGFELETSLGSAPYCPAGVDTIAVFTKVVSNDGSASAQPDPGCGTDAGGGGDATGG